MNLESALVLHDSFYALTSEDAYREFPYSFPQEIPFRDFDYIEDEEDD